MIGIILGKAYTCRKMTPVKGHHFYKGTQLLKRDKTSTKGHNFFSLTNDQAFRVDRKEMIDSL